MEILFHFETHQFIRIGQMIWLCIYKNQEFLNLVKYTNAIKHKMEPGTKYTEFYRIVIFN